MSRISLPLAFGRPTCQWRRHACDTLDAMNREYRILFTSWSATVIIAAVMSGLAISVLPECALRPGMRVLGEADGFGALPDIKIGIMRGHSSKPEIVDALARHITESLDNISVPMAEDDRRVRLRRADRLARTPAEAEPRHAGLVEWPDGTTIGANSEEPLDLGRPARANQPMSDIFSPPIRKPTPPNIR